MANKGAFKTYARTSRVIDVEDNYALGISYIDSPLPEGMCRLTVNLEFLNFGDTLKPRGGYQEQALYDLGVTDPAYYIHHVGSMYIDDIDNDDASLRRYILLGKPDLTDYGIDFNTAVLFIENPDTNLMQRSTFDIASVGAPLVKHSSNKNWRAIHGVPVINATPLGMNISVENNTYLMYKDNPVIGVGRLYAALTAGTYSHKLTRLTALEITPYQAINYGYNMLLDEPYQFANTLNPSGVLDLQGLLPYDLNGKLKFNAQVGEEIEFKLIYRYPSGSPTYKVQWETQEIGVVTAPTILQEAAASPGYTAGDEITYKMRPPFTQFSVIAKVYNTADMTKPVKVLVLPSYYLTQATDKSNKNIEPKNYNLATAIGASVFMSRVVLWGVDQAKNTLFVSDVKDPSYFPFPHGADPMGEDIVHCVPYLDKFLVFTETKLILLEPDLVTGSYNKKTIQENLNMNYFDRNTIKVVRNMVYFKSNNYYYMIVPNNNAGPGELQLAPISKPIERLLDAFEDSIKRILDSTYNIDFTLNTGGAEWTLTLVDFYNYLDNARMKNVYKYKLQYGTTIHYLEITLAYNTLIRNWTMAIMETNTHAIIPYRQMVTENAIYANLFQDESNNMQLQLIRKNELDAKDTFKLDGNAPRTIKNYQLLDTGKRDHMKDIKKKFREIQFVVNNLTGTDLEFYSNFIVDDDNRKQLFEYTTRVVSDPLDPLYGQIYVERSYVDPAFTQGTTILGTWKLGLSFFPPLTVVKVRIGVSGTGYSGRLKLLSVNEVMYELLNHNWVYRTMNAR